MNIKQLAEFFGKSTATIRRSALSVGIKFKNGTEKTFSKDEVKMISQYLYKTVPLAVKESIDMTFSNDKAKPYANEKHESTLTQKDIELISTIVSMTVSKTIESLDKRMNNIENKYEEKKALLPAPEKSDRDNLRQLVNSYANRKSLSHSFVWGKLYQEVYYRLNFNLKERAENRNMSIIDYAESQGMISELLSIAMEIFN